MGYQELDGPSDHYELTVTNTVAIRVKNGANSELSGRKIISVQPKDGKIYVYFAGDNETPALAKVQKGFTQVKKELRTYEASTSQWVYILAQSGTVIVSIAERS